MTTNPSSKSTWAHRVASDVYVRDCEDPTAQMRARVFHVDFDKEEAEVGFYPERGVQFSEIHLPDIYRATIPLSDLSLEPLSGAAEFGYADIIRRGDKTSDLSYMDWTGKLHTPVIKTDDDGQPRQASHLRDADGTYRCPQCGRDENGEAVHALTHHTLPPMSVEEAKAEVAGEAPADVGGFPGLGDALPEFVPSELRDTITPAPAPAPTTGVQRAGGTRPLFTREEVMRKFDQLTAEMRKLEEMITSME